MIRQKYEYVTVISHFSIFSSIVFQNTVLRRPLGGQAAPNSAIFSTKLRPYLSFDSFHSGRR
jgi:hypothetical protein